MILPWLVALASATAGVAASSSSNRFSELKSHGHPALVSKARKADNKWVIFTEQKKLHSSFARSGDDDFPIAETNFVVLDNKEFWTHHRDLLGIDARVQMKLKKSTTIKGSKVTNHLYNQEIEGFRVHGGDFIVTVGAHGGVTRANGLPVSSKQLDTYYAQGSILNNHIDMSQVDKIVEKYVFHRVAKG
jgi:hypothetical protein